MVNNTTLSQYTKQMNLTAAQKAAIDTNKYGFRFLYNPQTVSMNWGTTTEVNPQLESLGLDKGVPLTSGLNNTTVSFDLVLNRIDDMRILDSNGFKTIKGKQYKELYSPQISDAEAKLIYKKGTMYGLEYFFKAVNGDIGNYESYLNGSTSDRGWMFAIPVELHLGTGLRYLVRISSLAVNHNMFDERMVPIFSTVSIICTRYYDGKEVMNDTTKTGKK